MANDAIEVHRWLPGTMAEAEVRSAGLMRKAAFYGERGATLSIEAERQAVQENLAIWVRGEGDESAPMFHAIREGGVLVTVAETFVRTIRIGPERRERDVLALAGVVSDPAVRGRGLGAAVIRDAFARLDEEGIKQCLFQTGRARPLYERLGARLVTNRFVNRTAATREAAEANPWDDEWVMRFPAEAPWFDGVIDLNGPGY
ncbi:MAG: GNAT family N-acetyltransferase [Planctomycetota bacterium]